MNYVGLINKYKQTNINTWCTIYLLYKFNSVRQCRYLYLHLCTFMFVNTDIRSRERLVVVVFTSTRVYHHWWSTPAMTHGMRCDRLIVRFTSTCVYHHSWSTPAMTHGMRCDRLVVRFTSTCVYHHSWSTPAMTHGMRCDRLVVRFTSTLSTLMVYSRHDSWYEMRSSRS
jgi:hypothetical protein